MTSDDESEPMDVDTSCLEEEVLTYESCEDENEDDSEEEYVPEGERKTSLTFIQKELNDLIRTLGLPKKGAEYLAAVLKNKKFLSNGTNAYVYRNREES